MLAGAGGRSACVSRQCIMLAGAGGRSACVSRQCTGALTASERCRWLVSICRSPSAGIEMTWSVLLFIVDRLELDSRFAAGQTTAERPFTAVFQPPRDRHQPYSCARPDRSDKNRAQLKPWLGLSTAVCHVVIIVWNILLSLQ